MTNTAYTSGILAAAAASTCKRQRVCLLLDGVQLGHRSQGGGCRTPQTSRPVLGTLVVHLLLQTSARLVTTCRAHTCSLFAAFCSFQISSGVSFDQNTALMLTNNSPDVNFAQNTLATR